MCGAEELYYCYLFLDEDIHCYPIWVKAMQELYKKGDAMIAEESFRKFNREKHMTYFATEPWREMRNEHGVVLQGIRGKAGPAEIGSSGEEIGCDLIEMQPGSMFPLHTHAGDHILYALEGYGNVTIDGVMHRLDKGYAIFIAAEHAHCFGTYQDGPVFKVLAFGHPHRHIASTERMKFVESEV